MAGVKGRSGGARPNSGGARPNSGGDRPGAGRPKKDAPVIEVKSSDDPKAFLLSIMNDQDVDARLRIDAAKCLMPFVHMKLGEGGKKEQKQDAAKSVASRFAAAQPPKLVAAGGKKV